MSEMRASRKPFSSKICLAASSRRARVSAPLRDRGPLGLSSSRTVGTRPHRSSNARVFDDDVDVGYGPRAVLLQLTEDQEFFRDTTSRFLDERAPVGELRRLRDDPAGYEDKYWQQGAELGWT